MGDREQPEREPSAIESGFDELSLRERFPEYLAVFGVAAAVAVVIGVLFGIFTEPSITAAIAYTLMLLGAGFLLVGGLSGSGFNAGGFGGLFTASSDEDERRRDRERDAIEAAERRARQRGAEVDETSRSRHRRDPAEVVSRRLRAGPNPRAFWAVTGGFLYILLGIALVSVFP